MNRTCVLRVSLGVGMMLSSAVFGAEAPTFTAKPTAVKSGNGAKISFAVSAPTDVAVYIENAKGEVIRHLVAGALGNNPPAPLRPGLAQEIEWDGKGDYGRAVLPSVASGEGGYRVRVALGLSAKYDSVIQSKQDDLQVIQALGVGPDGTLYVNNYVNTAPWIHYQILAFDREGKYLRMVFPYPASLKKDAVAGHGVIDVNGQTIPAPWMQKSLYQPPDIATPIGPACTALAVSGDGKEIYGMGGRRRPLLGASIMRMGVDGSAPDINLFEPLGPGRVDIFEKAGGVALSSDGKTLFFAGLLSGKGSKESAAVYAIAVPERKNMKVFYGTPEKAGKEPGLLGGAVASIASDGKGRLVIADSKNGRLVVVSEADGKFVRDIKVDKVVSVGISRKSGVMYATTESGEGRSGLVRFDSVEAEKASASVGLPVWSKHCMAVDATSDNPVIWIGDVQGMLVRAEDAGGKITHKVVSPGRKKDGLDNSYLCLTADRLRREIYLRNGKGGQVWQRFSETTGKLESLDVPRGVGGGGGKGLALTPAPDGNLYGLKWPYQIYKMDRNGKPLAWENPRRPVSGEYDHTQRKGVQPKLEPDIIYGPTSMGEVPHTMGINWGTGNILVFETPDGQRSMKALLEYLPTGQLRSKDPVIWKATDAVVGPKLDAMGNIYIAEVVRPKGWYCPEELRQTETREDHGGGMGVAGNRACWALRVQLRERDVRRGRVRKVVLCGPVSVLRACGGYGGQSDVADRALWQRG
jgi:hypothetical protein